MFQLGQSWDLFLHKKEVNKLADANEMDVIFTEFGEKASMVTETMQSMSAGINDISVTVDKSAQLVNAISGIQAQTEENQAISQELEGEIQRFERV